MHKINLVLAFTLFLTAGVSTVAQAQDSGKDEAVETHSMGEKYADEAPPEDSTTWTASAGGVLSTGNTQKLTLNGGTDLALVRGAHGFGFKANVVYGLSDVVRGDGDTFETKDAFNVNAKARYDFYFTDLDAIFGAVAYRHDRFAGLEHRVQGQLGYLRNVFREENHRLWGELGGDLTYDYQYQDDGMGNITNGEETVFSIRAFVGYDNHLSETLTFATGLEFLLPPADVENVRVTWDNTLTSKLWESLSLELKFLALFDNEPVESIPAKSKLDTLTTLSLVYALL